MKKKRLFIIGLVVLIVSSVLLFPVTRYADDGGTKLHEALLYRVCVYHSMCNNDERFDWYRPDIEIGTDGYKTGIEIILLGRIVYRNTEFLTRYECECNRCKPT